MKSLFTEEGLLWISVVENQSYLKTFSEGVVREI